VSGPAAGSLTSILDLKALGAAAQKKEAPPPSGDVNNLAMKLAKLIKVGRDINSELNLNQLAEKVIDSALQVMRADRGLLMVDEGGKLVPLAQRDMESIMQQRDARGLVSRSIVELCSTTKEAVLVKDALADQRFQTSLSIQMYNIRSALCVPLINKDKFLGVLYVDNRIENFSFSDEDKELLTAFGDQAAIGLENAKLVAQIKAETKRTENLSRYLSRPIVKKILEHGGDLQLGGEKVLCTVLFADIRGFTSYSENREPHQVVEFLNDFLTKMTRIIFDKNGTLDKYLGDGLMAIFGAPFHMTDAAYWAVRSAVEMQACMARYKGEWETKYGFTGQLGIGVNSGEVTSGSIGSPDRMDYTVIGDAVNLGARLQAMAVKGDIVVSEFAYQQVKERIQVEPMGKVQVKGRTQPVEVFRILGLVGA
jgi:adenylate cyclase